MILQQDKPFSQELFEHITMLDYLISNGSLPSKIPSSTVFFGAYVKIGGSRFFNLSSSNAKSPFGAEHPIEYPANPTQTFKSHFKILDFEKLESKDFKNNILIHGMDLFANSGFDELEIPNFLGYRLKIKIQSLTQVDEEQRIYRYLNYSYRTGIFKKHTGLFSKIYEQLKSKLDQSKFEIQGLSLIPKTSQITESYLNKRGIFSDLTNHQSQRLFLPLSFDLNEIDDLINRLNL